MSLTFGQFLAEFRTDFGGWSPNTWRGLSGMLRKLEEEFGDEFLGSITTPQIERYLTRRRNEDGVTASTTNRYLATLKTLFKTASNWDYITDDPTSGVAMLKEQSRVPDALSDSDLAALIEACPDRTRHVVIMAADTGMRRSEMQRLTWRDVGRHRDREEIKEQGLSRDPDDGPGGVAAGTATARPGAAR